jgi:Ca-activated chloride channel family protein
VRRLFDHELPGDQYQLVAFNDSPSLICPLTSYSGVVNASLGSLTARGWTSLYDGIYFSSRLMNKASNFSRALVVLSDGADNFSRYRESELRSLLLEAGVVVYAVSLNQGFLNLDSRPLRRITEETGGLFYSLDNSTGLGPAISSISEAIRHQYVIGFVSNQPQARKHRRIGVKVVSPTGERLTASWRTGYYSPDSY